MTQIEQDKKTIHLIIWIAFAHSLMNFLLYVIGIIVVVNVVTNPDPTVIVALLAAGAANLQGAGFLALLARTRSDSQPVTVQNTPDHPVPTEPQTDEKKEETP